MLDLRRISIATRLAGGFLIMTLIVLLLGGMSLRQTSAIHAEAVELEALWMPRLRLLSGINQDFLRFRIFVQRTQLASDERVIAEQRRTLAHLAQELETKEQALS